MKGAADMNENTELESRLISAVVSKNIVDVEACVIAGARGDVLNAAGETALHIAASYPGVLFLRSLLHGREDSYKPDLSVRNQGGLTPALVAARAGNWKNVLIMARRELATGFMSHTASLAFQPVVGIPPAGSLRTRLMRYREEQGRIRERNAQFALAFPYARDSFKLFRRDFFQFSEALGLALTAYQPAVVEALLEAEAPVDWRDPLTNDSPFHVAVQCMDTTMFRFFVRRGYDLSINYRNGSGMSLLDLAVVNDNVHMVAILALYEVGRKSWEMTRVGVSLGVGVSLAEHPGCQAAILNPEHYMHSSIEITLFYLLTARAHDQNPFHFIDIDILKMIFRLAYPGVNAASVESTVTKAKENYIDNRAGIMTRWRERKVREEKDAEVHRKQEQKRELYRYTYSVEQFVENYLYFELLQPKPFAVGDDLELLGELIRLLNFDQPTPMVKDIIKAFPECIGSKKSRALTMLLKHNLCQSSQENQADVVAEINSRPFAIETDWSFPRHTAQDYLERAKRRSKQSNNDSGAANDYCVFILIDCKNFKEQEEALKSLHALGSKILGKDLCPALVVKALVKIMLTKVADRPMMDAVLEVLGLEALFSKDPFTPRKPTFFSDFFSTKAPYTITTAVAYVRIAALDAQDIEEMRERLENGSENKVDKILLRVAGEFSQAIQKGQAPCLKLLIAESFKEQIEKLQALAKPTVSLEGTFFAC